MFGVSSKSTTTKMSRKNFEDKCPSWQVYPPVALVDHWSLTRFVAAVGHGCASVFDYTPRVLGLLNNEQSFKNLKRKIKSILLRATQKLAQINDLSNTVTTPPLSKPPPLFLLSSVL